MIKSLVVKLAKKYAISAVKDAIGARKDEVGFWAKKVGTWLVKLNCVTGFLTSLANKLEDGVLDDVDVEECLKEVDALAKKVVE